MIFYGPGVLTAPGSSRVVHDFEDGPYETLNPEIIAEAKRQGFKTEEAEKPKRGRKPGVKNGRSENDGTT
jgi:hypothetical protein